MSEWDKTMREAARQIAGVMRREHSYWVGGLERLDKQTALALEKAADWLDMMMENSENE